jgi:hypothetical protein
MAKDKRGWRIEQMQGWGMVQVLRRGDLLTFGLYFIQNRHGFFIHSSA